MKPFVSTENKTVGGVLFVYNVPIGQDVLSFKFVCATRTNQNEGKPSLALCYVVDVSRAMFSFVP